MGAALLAEYILVESTQSDSSRIAVEPELPSNLPAELEAPPLPERVVAQTVSNASSVTEEFPRPLPGQTEASPSNIDSDADTSGDDLAMRYRIAIRQHIVAKWQVMTSRELPQTCNVAITQQPGGVVLSATADCAPSDFDRHQLEAVVLMAQPLPYDGYESVYSAELALRIGQ